MFAGFCSVTRKGFDDGRVRDSANSVVIRLCKSWAGAVYVEATMVSVLSRTEDGFLTLLRTRRTKLKQIAVIVIDRKLAHSVRKRFERVTHASLILQAGPK